MWKITTRGFTLQEVLILAAMNIAASENSEQQTQKRSASQNDKELKYAA
jgi:hypothetical protein